MRRLFAVLVLGGLALAPPAVADVIPLADRDHTGVPALDGDRVVYRIRCITAPGPPCRIDLRVYGVRGRLARRFVTIPRGRSRFVRVPVRAEHFLTSARVIDPDGRRRIAIRF